MKGQRRDRRSRQYDSLRLAVGPSFRQKDRSVVKSCRTPATVHRPGQRQRRTTAEAALRGLATNVMNPNSVRRLVSRLGQSDRQKVAVWRKSQTQDAARFLQPSFERCVRDIPDVYNAVGVAAGEESSVCANGEDLLSAEIFNECPVLQHFAL